MRLIFWATLALLIFHGADVNDAQPSLGIESGVKLIWPTSTGVTYRVQWSPGSAGPGPWTDLGAPMIGNASLCFEMAIDTVV